MPAPRTYSYLSESTGRPVFSFRLTLIQAGLSLKSGSPMQLLQSDLSSRCHPDNPRSLGNFVVRGFSSSQSVFVLPDRAEACSLFALQSCVFGCEGNVADVRKTV